MAKTIYSVLGKCVIFGGCIFILLTTFPIAQIALGAVYMHECPAAPLVPVYVMVGGILALLLMGLYALPKLLCPAAQGNTIWTVGMFSLVLFAFIWFLFGSYQIYSVYPPNYIKNTIDPNSFNNSNYTPTAPDSKTDLTLENHNQSLPNLNQSRPNLNHSFPNHNLSLPNLNQSLPNLNQSLPNVNQSLPSVNQSLPNLNQRFPNFSQSLPNLNQSTVINNNQSLPNPIQTLALSNISSRTNREHMKTPQADPVTAAVPHCNKSVYLFAFWTTTLVYALAGNFLFIFICIYGLMKVGNKLSQLV